MITRSVAARIFCAFYVVFMITSSGSFEISDGGQRYQTAVSWFEGHGGDLQYIAGPREGAQGTQGRRFSYYGPLQSVLMLPAIATSRVLLLHASPDRAAKLAIALVITPAISALTLLLLFTLLLRMEFAPRIALFTTMVMGLCTPLWHYSRTGQEENLVALAWVMVLHGLVRIHAADPRGLFWAAAGASTAIATRLATGPVLGVLGVAIAVETVRTWRTLQTMRRVRGEDRFQPWIRCLVPSAALLGAVVALLLLYNTYRFGDPLETGYGIAFRELHMSLFDTHDMLPRITALLFSPHRGLLWYCPSLVILAALLETPLRGITRRAGGYALCAWCASLLFFGTYTVWDAGFAWGPRFLVAPLVLLAPLFAAVFANGVRLYPWLAFSGFVQMLSVMVAAGAENYRFAVMNEASAGTCTPWVCGCTPLCLRLPWTVRAVEAVWSGARFPSFEDGAALTHAQVLASSDYNTVYWWLVRLAERTHAIPPRAAFLVSLLVLAGALFALFQLHRSLAPGQAREYLLPVESRNG
ncbi:hypothetical protein [Pendulispora albinea]|uniref:Glycosyltransferase RgtA/B/C/D-like domain-containing protein n=1 Tax=Pendulispora albinea TaxID=2741071 RepID=A0ABZ2M275_9BACT